MSIIFQRVIFEMSFYGLMICSYLAWVSILYSVIKTQMIGYISAGLILGLWIVLGFFFIKFDHETVNLAKYSKNNKFKKR